MIFQAVVNFETVPLGVMIDRHRTTVEQIF
jgi:hypothetical protein